MDRTATIFPFSGKTSRLEEAGTKRDEPSKATGAENPKLNVGRMSL
ncbi:MAG: hypothetical protein KKB39_02690 [Nanoarchaeota archaeon]|nr:hypothetical protein [Nanoarchaeota archaeon]MCG2719665.1 hypothetical protein [Nanoarchaeota archaeon]